MADETLTPQVGDVWIGADRTTRLVCTTGPMMFALAKDFRHVGETSRDFVEWFAGARLVLRDGKSYQSPTPSQGGDVITVEIVVVGEPGKRRIGWEEGETVEKQLNWARQCGLHPHDCTIRAALPVRTTPLIEGAVELPPVTATPA